MFSNVIFISNLTSLKMNNIKVYFRNLWANKTISCINIIGLSLGLAAVVLIVLWVENEYSYNMNIPDHDRIAAIMVNQSFESGEIQTYPATPPPLSKKLMEATSGIEAATTTSWGDQIQFKVGDNTFIEYGLYASHEFLDVFGIQLIAGVKSAVLKKPRTIVLTKQLATKYFGTVDAIGKNIQIGNNIHYEVVGVMGDSPDKTTLRYNFLMPISDYFSYNPFMINDWSVNNVRTYVKLENGSDFNEVNTKIKTLLHPQHAKQKNCDMFVWEMKDWYLKGMFKSGHQVGGRIKHVRLFSIIAVIILLLSCINFVNLTTAGATRRLKEIGVRKSLGANRLVLIKFFLSESIILVCIASLLSVATIWIFLPMFNAAFDLSLSVGFLEAKRIFLFIVMVILVGVLAGFYPALLLSSVDSISALKKSMTPTANSTTNIRKILVTSQFVVTILLITSAVVVSKQLDYFFNKDLGVNPKNLIWFSNQIQQDKIDVAMSEILQIKGVEKAALASMTFQGSNNRGSEVIWPDKKKGEDVFFNFIAGSHDLPAAMDLEVIQGRSFSKDYATDTSAVLINETAAKQMDLKQPIGQILDIRGIKSTIVGVLRDFHFESLHNTIGPVIMSCRPDWTWLMYVKMDGKKNKAVINSIEKTYQKFASGHIFEYSYQSDQPKWFYRSEEQTSILIKWFSAFAVFLSCLGLFGLTLFTIERRRKEIGIRKLLGAEILHLILLVSKQFLALIFMAIGIAIIPSYYLTHQWLNGFAYSTSIPWYVYLLGPLSALILAICTMGILVYKASLENPIKSLQAE